MKRFIRMILVIFLSIITAPVVTHAEKWVKEYDVPVIAEFTDDYIDSNNQLVIGSGLKEIQFQINDGEWSAWQTYDLSVPVVEEVTKYIMVTNVTLTKGGANWVRCKVSDNVDNISDVVAVKVNVDAKNPQGAIKITGGHELP